MTPEGLRSVKNFNINGRVEAMKFFRQQGMAKDRLFIVTSRHNAMILGCNCAVKMRPIVSNGSEPRNAEATAIT